MIRLTGESNKAFVENVYFQWVYTRNQYIKPYIEFVSVDKQWVRNILAYDVLLICWRELIEVCQKKDTTASRRLSWFHNPYVVISVISWGIIIYSFTRLVHCPAPPRLHLQLILAKDIFELSQLVWKHVSFWQIIEFIGSKLLSHPHEVVEYPIFTSQFCRVYEMVYPLSISHLIIDLCLMIEAIAGP